jgi:hypothetical protein
MITQFLFLNLLLLNNPASTSYNRQTNVIQINSKEESLSDSIHVLLTGASNAFMCPFLTPMFIEKLKANKAVGVMKNQDLTIQFTMAKSDFSEELILRIAENIGYMRSFIQLATLEK